MDLRHPDALKKNLDDRFVGRVFLPEEKRLIFSDSDPGRTLWQFWAAKETAYKIISKSHPAIHSGPLKYRVTLPEGYSISSTLQSCRTGQITCCVETPVDDVIVAIQNEADYLHAFGCCGPITPGTMQLKVFRLDHACFADRTESDAVRTVLCRHLSRFWGIPAGAINVRRDPAVRGAGPPVVCVSGKPASMDISLSHHGRYGAFVWFGGQSSANKREILD